MQTYSPTWYYGTFVPAVGNAATWTQNLVTSTYNYVATGQTSSLGLYEARTMPTMGVSGNEMYQMGLEGGDWGMEDAYEYYVDSVGGGGCHTDECPKVKSK
jgi:hypothetical protein